MRPSCRNPRYRTSLLRQIGYSCVTMAAATGGHRFLNSARWVRTHRLARWLDGQWRRHMLWHMLNTGGQLLSHERHVKLFKNGRNQAVRIPREFELPGEDAIMRKEGDKLIIEPAPPKSLLALLETLSPLDEDFPPIDDPAPDPVAF
jgi:antitoxin VapB